MREEGERQAPSRLTLLCQSQGGYRNLARLVTRAYLEGQERGVPRIERRWLSRASLEGLIALSGATDGDVGRALVNARERDAERALDVWLALFPDRFYLELQRLGRPVEEAYIAGAVALAARRGVPVVATNDVRFLTPERVRIARGARVHPRRRAARRCRPRTPLHAPAVPAHAAGDGGAVRRRPRGARQLGGDRAPLQPGADAWARCACRTIRCRPGRAPRSSCARRARAVLRRASRRAGGVPPGTRERLGRELDVICQMGFAGYFLIVADFIRWAREQRRAGGTGARLGRGLAGRLRLRITDLDPLHYDLLFERFLNPERVSMPDFDIDFCMDGRDRVIDYVAEKYGRERVSQIITYGTMAAKAVVRDVGRVLGMAYGYVDRIAKLIPFELGITLDAALEKEPELKRLYEAEEEVQNLIDLARSLEGLTRNAGMHAGGVVIAPSVLTDFAPLYCDAGGGSVVTQFDKDDVEAAGLVKFDFLGLRTLTIIDCAAALINRERAAGQRAAHRERAADGRCRRPTRCSSPAAPPRSSSSSRAA